MGRKLGEEGWKLKRQVCMKMVKEGWEWELVGKVFGKLGKRGNNGNWEESCVESKKKSV